MRKLRSVTINALSGSPEYEEYYRAAEMCLDLKSATNLIANRLTTEVLELPIQPFDAHNPEPKALSKSRIPVEGYVDIHWRLDGSTDRTILGPTRFFVSSTSEPEYDLVMGKQDCIRFGLVKPSNRWSLRNKKD